MKYIPSPVNTLGLWASGASCSTTAADSSRVTEASPWDAMLKHLWSSKATGDNVVICP